MPKDSSVHWDDVPRGLSASSMNDLTPEQRSVAMAWAQDHAERLPEMGGIEFWMAQYFSHTIDDTQRHQLRAQIQARRQLRNMPYHAVVYPDGTVYDYEQAMAEIESWRDWQDAQEELRAMQEAVVKVVNELGTTFAAAAKALHEAIISASPAIQDLLDALGALPSEPAIEQAQCPKHGRPMKGGRCKMCNR